MTSNAYGEERVLSGSRLPEAHAHLIVLHGYSDWKLLKLLDLEFNHSLVMCPAVKTPPHAAVTGHRAFISMEMRKLTASCCSLSGSKNHRLPPARYGPTASGRETSTVAHMCRRQQRKVRRNLTMRSVPNGQRCANFGERAFWGVGHADRGRAQLIANSCQRFLTLSG